MEFLRKFAMIFVVVVVVVVWVFCLLVCSLLLFLLFLSLLNSDILRYSPISSRVTALQSYAIQDE